MPSWWGDDDDSKKINNMTNKKSNKSSQNDSTTTFITSTTTSTTTTTTIYNNTNNNQQHDCPNFQNNINYVINNSNSKRNISYNNNNSNKNNKNNNNNNNINNNSAYHNNSTNEVKADKSSRKNKINQVKNNPSPSARVTNPAKQSGWNPKTEIVDIPETEKEFLSMNRTAFITSSVSPRRSMAFIVDMKKPEGGEKRGRGKEELDKKENVSSSVPSFQIQDHLCSFLPRSRKMSMIKRETILKMKFVNEKGGSDEVVERSLEERDDATSEHGTYLVEHDVIVDDVEDVEEYVSDYVKNDVNFDVGVYVKDGEKKLVETSDELDDEVYYSEEDVEKKEDCHNGTIGDLEKSSESFYESAYINSDSLESSTQEVDF